MRISFLLASGRPQCGPGRPFQKGGSDGEAATGAPDILEGFPGLPGTNSVVGARVQGAPGRPFQKGRSDGEAATGASDILEGFPGAPGTNSVVGLRPPEAPRRFRATSPELTLCYTILFPGRTSAFRAGFGPDCYREGSEINPPAGLRPAGGPISGRPR